MKRKEMVYNSMPHVDGNKEEDDGRKKKRMTYITWAFVHSQNQN